MHKDKYGREWNHEPDHDTGRMLQIDPAIMLLAYNFHLKIRSGGDFEGAHSTGWPVQNPDCYLLKMGGGEWVAGIRLSSEGSDYLSPYFDPKVIEFMIQNHMQRCDSVEYQAYFDLVRLEEVKPLEKRVVSL